MSKSASQIHEKLSWAHFLLEFIFTDECDMHFDALMNKLVYIISYSNLWVLQVFLAVKIDLFQEITYLTRKFKIKYIEWPFKYTETYRNSAIPSRRSTKPRLPQQKRLKQTWTFKIPPVFALSINSNATSFKSVKSFFGGFRGKHRRDQRRGRHALIKLRRFVE